MTARSRRAIGAASTAALTLTWEAAAWAQGQNGEKTPLDLDEGARQTQAQAAGGGGGVLRTILGLIAVVAIIYGLYWVLGRVKRSREEQESGFGLRSMATLPLGTGRTLHMVRVGREVVLLGVAEQGVTSIRTYTESAALQAGLIDPDDDPFDLAPDDTDAAFPARPATPRALVNTLRSRTVRR